MRYEKVIKISECDADTIDYYTHHKPKSWDETLYEDEVISYSANFGNGIEMDIKCCGVQYKEGESNLAWTEAVLFKEGSEVCCSEPSDEYLGEWILEYDDNEYVVVVEVK